VDGGDLIRVSTRSKLCATRSHQEIEHDAVALPWRFGKRSVPARLSRGYGLRRGGMAGEGHPTGFGGYISKPITPETFVAEV
jgi:hypothetical protein